LFDFDIGSPETSEEIPSFMNGLEEIDIDNLEVNYSKSSSDESMLCQSFSSGLFSELVTPSPPVKGEKI